MKTEKPEDFENFKSDEPCISCGENRDGYVCYHHIYSRGAYPEFAHKDWNKAPQCARCHVPLWHTKGTTWMANKFPRVRKWLKENGWYFCEVFKKWKNENL